MQDIAVVRPDGSGFRNLTGHPAGGYLPFWTNDGRWLVYGPHWRVRPNGVGRVRLPADFDLGDAMSFDGRFIATNGYILDSRGRTVRDMRPRFGGCFEVFGSVWSPDGRYLALSAWRCDDERARTLLVRADGKRPARLLERRGLDVEGLSFSRDGGQLLVLVDGNTPFVISVGTGAWQRLRGGILGTRAIDWSPDGRRLAYVGRRGGLYVTPASDGRGRLLARTASAKAGLAWSPRGDRIAFCDRTGLHLVRVASGHVSTLTRLCGYTTPAWKSDGKALTFSSDEEEIFTVSVQTRRVRRVVNAALYADWPIWAPDRSHIAFARGTHSMTREATLGVYVVRPNGTELRRLGRGYSPEWSPDSRHLVYVDPLGTSDPPGKYAAGRIIVAALDGTSKQVATGTAPVWSPDGKTIAFMRYRFSTEPDDYFGRGGVLTSTLSVVGADGSGERVLAQSVERGYAQFTPCWAPDGSAIAVDERQFDETNPSNPLPHRVTLIDPVSGAARPLAGLDASFVSLPGSLRWSPDSRRILVNEPTSVLVLDVATSSFRPLVSEPESSGWKFVSPVWSPDGGQVAYVRYREGDDATVSDVWTVRQDGSDRRRVLKTSAVEHWVAWAPATPSPPAPSVASP